MYFPLHSASVKLSLQPLCDFLRREYQAGFHLFLKNVGWVCMKHGICIQLACSYTDSAAYSCWYTNRRDIIQMCLNTHTLTMKKVLMLLYSIQILLIYLPYKQTNQHLYLTSWWLKGLQMQFSIMSACFLSTFFFFHSDRIL